jgi:hypothetical protein
LVLLCLHGWAGAGVTVYQKPSAFLAEVFGGSVPATKAIRLSSSHQAQIKRLLGHSYRPSMLRYWRQGDTMAVILEEVGKVEPITTGFVVKGGRIARVRILIYRESHGMEVARTSFTKQFRGTELSPAGRLSRRVDGISGATLSVRAVTGLARVALYLDRVAPK